MTKFIAQVGLLAAALALTLGNYWYTFALWPKSWWSFSGFWFGAIILLILRTAIDKESE